MDPSLSVLIEGVETEVEAIEGILKRIDVGKISHGHHRKRRFVYFGDASLSKEVGSCGATPWTSSLSMENVASLSKKVDSYGATLWTSSLDRKSVV